MTTLPDALRTALDRTLAGQPADRLAAASEGLSRRYREEATASPRIRTAEDVAAYAATRLPATYAAAAAAMAEVRERLPGWAPRSLLDLGAGRGAPPGPPRPSGPRSSP